MFRSMGPLDGIRVVELGNDATLFAGRLLADLGAEVVLIEPPGGSGVRLHAPFLDDVAGLERSYEHLAYNAGKRSLVLDPASAALDGLVATADAVLEAPPTYADAIDRRAANPRLVHAVITPFGPHESRRAWKGGDLVASAAGGLVHVSGEPERPPILAGANVSTKLASLAATTGILAALVARDGPRGGSGARIDVSMQECVTLATFQTSNATYWRWHGIAPPRNTAVEFPIVQCRDGLWALARARPDRWRKLRAWALGCGLPVRWSDDEWQQAHQGRLASFRLGDAADLIEQLASFYDREEFLERCWAAEIVTMPLHDFAQMAACEHLQEIGTFREIRHDPLGATLGIPRSPFYSLRGVQPLSRAPRLGEHTEAIAERPAPTVTHASEARPLEGVRVLELGLVLAGPIGARILSNLGAEVIKVESEAKIDPVRRSAPPSSGPTLNAGGIFNTANTGKLSATINTKAPGGKELLLRLAASCDAVVDNLRPGVTARMGIPYEELSHLNPGTIMVHLPGCGMTGPWAGLTSFGNQVSAAAGLNAVTGFPGTPPTGVGVAFADFVSPYFLASSVMAAILERNRTGKGQEIDGSQLPAMISLLSAEWMYFAHTGEEPPRRANRDPNYAPHGVYPARGEDEWVAIAVYGDEEFAAFASAIGQASLSHEPRFATHEARKTNEDALDATVSAWTREHDRWEAATRLQSHGIAAAPVESIADQLDRDPGLAGHWQVVRQPTDPDLEITVNREPIRVDGLDGAVSRSPALGEHNEYVFRELLGMSEDEFVEAVASGAIG